MQSVIAYFSSLGGWNWMLLAVLMFVLETVIPGVHFIWFGVAAALVATLTLLAAQFMPPGLGFELQLLAFGALAAAVLVWSRRFASRNSDPTDVPGLNERGQQYVGRVVVVAQALRNGRGRVTVDDSVWTAEGPDLDAGAKARVTGVNGTVLRIEKV